VRVVPELDVRRRHRVHPGGIDAHVVEQGLAGLRLVPLRIPLRGEPLVAPGDLYVGPVDCLASRAEGHLLQHADAVATTGQHERSHPVLGLHVDQLRDQPGRGRRRKQLVALVHDDVLDRHDETASASWSFSAETRSTSESPRSVASYTSSEDRRRSSSVRQSSSWRRCSETRRSGWPGWVSRPLLPSGLTISIGPDGRSSTADTMPGPRGWSTRRTGTSRYTASQAASRSVDGESASPVTVALVTGSYGGRSSAEASTARHEVSRVQARSVSPST